MAQRPTESNRDQTPRAIELWRSRLAEWQANICATTSGSNLQPRDISSTASLRRASNQFETVVSESVARSFETTQGEFSLCDRCYVKNHADRRSDITGHTLVTNVVLAMVLATLSVGCQGPAFAQERRAAAGKQTSVDRDKGYLVFGYSALKNLPPSYVPAPGDAVQTVTFSLARDEYESVQIGVHAIAGDLQQVQFTVESDLNVTVYHRIDPAIRDRLVSLYEQGDGIARWLPSEVHLQRGDVFAALPAGQSVNFWLTFRADAETRTGLHHGKIRIKPRGKPPTEVNLEVTVRSFQLHRPRAAFGMFFREDMLPQYFEGLAAPMESVLSMYRDMAQHGHNSGWFYPAATFAHLPPTASHALDKLLPLAKQAGLLDPMVPSMICGGIPGDLDATQLRAAVNWLAAEQKKRDWPEMIVFGTDEPEYPRDADVVRKELQRFRGVPIRVNVDLSATAAYGYGDLCDVLTVMDGEISPEMQVEAARRGTEIWTYSYRIWREDYDPLRQRFYAGLYTWTHKLGGNWVWAYHHAHHRHAWFAPQSHQPMPVTGYEARREGIDDYRYLQMVEDGIASAPNSRLALEAARWLESLRGRLAASVPNRVKSGQPLAIDEYDAIRARAADYIGALGPIAPVTAVRRLNAKDEAAVYRGKSVAACLAGLNHPRRSQRRAAAWALFELGTQAAPATPALADALGDPVVRIPALRALEAIGPPAYRAVPRIAALLQHPDFFVRIGALFSLGEIGCPFDRRDRSGRRSASKRAAHVVDALVIGLSDERGSLSYQAAEMLSVLGQTAESAVPPASAMLDDASPRRRAAAIGLITALGPDARAAVPKLIELHRIWDSRHFSALAAIGPAAAEALDELERHAKMEGGTRRADALQALYWIRGEASDLREMVELLRDPNADTATKTHVVTRLNQLGAKAESVADEVRAMLASGGLVDWEPGLKAFLEEVNGRTVPGIVFQW